MSNASHSSGLSRLRNAFGIFLLMLALIWAAGFLWFTSMATRQASPYTEPADAIVALTGGADRLDAAMTLLKSGKGQRLLITGVNPDIPAAALRDLIGDAADNFQSFDCCVDLDRAAVNTVGNAEETAEWARRNGYRSLIVVTSAYHMPRSLLELKRTIPEVRLIPYPVLTGGVDFRRWWMEPATTRLLIAEYTKYLVTLAKTYG